MISFVSVFGIFMLFVKSHAHPVTGEAEMVKQLADFTCNMSAYIPTRHYYHGSGNDKTALLFGFDGRGFSTLNRDTGEVEGQTVDLVRAMCDHIGACCEFMGFSSETFHDDSGSKTFSYVLEKNIVEILADITPGSGRGYPYTTNSQKYFKNSPNNDGHQFRMVENKSTSVFTKWFDAALTFYITTDDYNTVCQNSEVKYPDGGKCLN